MNAGDGTSILALKPVGRINQSPEQRTLKPSENGDLLNKQENQHLLAQCNKTLLFVPTCNDLSIAGLLILD